MTALSPGIAGIAALQGHAPGTASLPRDVAGVGDFAQLLGSLRSEFPAGGHAPVPALPPDVPPREDAQACVEPLGADGSMAMLALALGFARPDWQGAGTAAPSEASDARSDAWLSPVGAAGAGQPGPEVPARTPPAAAPELAPAPSLQSASGAGAIPAAVASPSGALPAGVASPHAAAGRAPQPAWPGLAQPRPQPRPGAAPAASVEVTPPPHPQPSRSVTRLGIEAEPPELRASFAAPDHSRREAPGEGIGPAAAGRDIRSAALPTRSATAGASHNFATVVPPAAASSPRGHSALPAGASARPMALPDLEMQLSAGSAAAAAKSEAATSAKLAPGLEGAAMEANAGEAAVATLQPASSSGIAPPAAASPAGPAQHASAGALPAEVGRPDWFDALGRHLVRLGPGRHQVELQLNPEHLGPLKVSLALHEQQAELVFSSAQPAVRQALEAGLPQLRESFAQSGIQLGDTSVGTDAHPSGQSADTRDGPPAQARAQASPARGTPDEPQARVTAPRVPPLRAGGVDLFA